VGLRSGEKVHEELFGDGEVDTRPRHPLISHVAVQPLESVLVLSTPSDARAMMIDVIAKP
jgi:FlaA1/EpsC-like NDP-sugar epimerase